jgi:predicted hydrocarbon binding protein
VTDLEQTRKTLQEIMNFTTALAYGMEQIADRGANGMAFVAGKNLGQKLAEQSKKTDNIDEALDEVRRILRANSYEWAFEPFKRKNAPPVASQPDGSHKVELVFRDCMIRQSLFRYGHTQKGSMCYMMYGCFSGALEAILGRKAVLDITHAGPNACLKSLTVHPKQ